MTPEQINRAIAEHLGWTWTKHDNGTTLRRPDGTVVNHNYAEEWRLPNYVADLNAMHEAEKLCLLDDEQQLTFVQLLLPPPFCDKPSWRGIVMVSQVTAAQRAEAFLRTVGKWKD